MRFVLWLLASLMLVLAAPLPTSAAVHAITTGPSTARGSGFHLPAFLLNPNLLLIFHGDSRDADGYRDSARGLADQRCLVLVAPLFDEDRFSNDEYHRGDTVDSRGRLQPSSEWTTRFVELIIPWASEIGGTPKVYLYGHSAGGQFLSRVAAYERIPGIAHYVVANPSTHVLPSLRGRALRLRPTFDKLRGARGAASVSGAPSQSISGKMTTIRTIPTSPTVLRLSDKAITVSSAA